jgi:DNA-directed RNA polymerase specialized sigma24 family protein
MTPRETLESCRSMAQEVAAMARTIDLAERRIPMGPTDITGIRLGGTPGGNDNERAAMDKLDGLEEWLKRDKAELVLLADQVEVLLESLTEAESRKIIRLYYIDALSDTEVAMAMGYHFRQTAQSKRNVILAYLEYNA